MKKLNYLLVYFCFPIRRLIGISILSTLFITNFSLSQWVWQNPLPHGNSTTSISFFNRNTGWWFSKYSNNYKTTNAGLNWTNASNNIGFNVFASGFFTFDSINYTGWIGGDSGKIYKTTNMGLNWISKNLPTNKTISSFRFINQNTGFVSANNLFKTTNGGDNWTVVLNYPDFYDCYFINAFTGWSISYTYNLNLHSMPSEYFSLYKTTNGGDNWTVIFNYTNNQTYFGYYLKKIYFKDSLSGITGGCGGAIFKTSNGGYNWGLEWTSGYYYDFYSKNLMYRNNQSNFQRSTDFGLNWLTINSTQMPAVNENIVKAVDSALIFVSGAAGNLWKTTNGGSNWNNYITSVSNNSFLSITASDTMNLWANAGTGTSLKTTNGGNNWLIDTSQNKPISCYFLNNSTGWLICNTGNFLKTVNGGLNWNLINLNDTGKTQYFKVFNNGIGYVLKNYNNNYISYKTTDYGNNWQFFGYLTKGQYYFINPDTAYIVSGLSINISTDGGLSWGPAIYTFTTVYSYIVLDKVNFVDGNTAIARISYGVPVTPGWSATSILKSTNGGYNWNGIYTVDGTGGKLLEVPNITNYYFSVRNKLYYSTNSGLNWQTSIYNDNDISNICILKNKIWSVSGNNILTGIGMVHVNIKKIENTIPDKLSLSQNYPNPFNPTTIIKFQIKDTRLVTLRIYDILGKEIATLVNEKLKAGEYETMFDGSGLASGIYFYTLSADGNRTDTKKMLMIK